MPLQLRRGTEAERQAMTQPLQEGEPLFIVDENTLYIGIRNPDGSLPLPRNLQSTNVYTDDHARAAIADMLYRGSHPDLQYQFNEADESFNIVLDLSHVNQDIIPDAGGSRDLGTYEKPFRDLYLSGNSLWLGNAQISADESIVNLPAGSTVGGVDITATGITEGANYIINIVDTEGVVIVNQETKQLTGDLIGDVTGNLHGNVYGEIYASHVYCDQFIIPQYCEFKSLEPSEAILAVKGNNDQGIISIVTQNLDSPIDNSTSIGSIVFSIEDINGERPTSYIRGHGDRIYITQSTPLGVFSDNNTILFDQFGNLVIGGVDPHAKLDVRGDIQLSGNIIPEASVLDIQGSLRVNGTVETTDGYSYGPAVSSDWITPPENIAQALDIIASERQFKRYIAQDQGLWNSLDVGGVPTTITEAIEALVIDANNSLTDQFLNTINDVSFKSVTADVVYTPAVDTNWADPKPTTVADALDRLAAAIFALNGNNPL